MFYFADYQGTRQAQGIDTGEIGVPSNADRTGDLSDMVDSNGNTLLTGTVGGPYFASLLTQKLGYTVTQGEPYYFNGCSQTDAQSGQCVFGNAQIPQSAWSVPVGSPFARASQAPGNGYHWGSEAHHPELPRGTQLKVGTVGTIEQILHGPSTIADGSMNMMGALRRTMATSGYSDLKEFQRVEVVVTPSAQRR